MIAARCRRGPSAIRCQQVVYISAGYTNLDVYECMVGPS